MYIYIYACINISPTHLIIFLYMMWLGCHLVSFEQALSFGTQNSTVFFHLRNIAHFRNSLSADIVKMLIHVFITSHMHSCNALLFGLPVRTLKNKVYAFRCDMRILQYIMWPTCRSYHLDVLFEQPK